MVGAAVMLIVGMLMGFYSQAGALAAIDFNTLGLLLGMMILVRLLEQTGFFEYIAIFTGKRVGGRPWLLLLVLGGATTVLSMFLDNVTTVVLIVPVTILIAQILGLSPLPFLMAEALLSNIGGVATLVGDPPNVLIGSASGLSFAAFPDPSGTHRCGGLARRYRHSALGFPRRNGRAASTPGRAGQPGRESGVA